jgi:hypothetical protein
MVKYIQIWAGNAPGQYELGDEANPQYDWHIEVTETELAELKQLQAARDAYYKRCRELKARERDPIG